MERLCDDEPCYKIPASVILITKPTNIEGKEIVEVKLELMLDRKCVKESNGMMNLETRKKKIRR